ncbi:helix-turn-helix domain-containing protein [Prevotella sp. E13-17]|uniref:helix-turn-helix domain-containing protein n=1 Tax=Prevotella sp. E13-17 TaxID=2913616 RepID=UPI001EDB3B49|nr:helix-turn-helix transcriptional regulator [Prevotella sp. E13-17]UKK51870.1 helix-turn-helix domain-containing protein [Prevotella sp. E13-17]
MKDRIRQIMESQHMTQQVFADFIGTTPATLSGIFNDRTRPTINIVEAIKKKIPNINTDWLLFGTGDMYQHSSTPDEEAQLSPENGAQGGLFSSEQMLDFSGNPAPMPQNAVQTPHFYNGVRNTHLENVREEVRIVDKQPRKVTEIRVYYDDQTWESFVPSKK